jgi:hypothetical protein
VDGCCDNSDGYVRVRALVFQDIWIEVLYAVSFEEYLLCLISRYDLIYAY